MAVALKTMLTGYGRKVGSNGENYSENVCIDCRVLKDWWAEARRQETKKEASERQRYGGI
jgi:hypothetical protein